MSPAIPPALVEAAARAMHEHGRLEWLNEPHWDGLNEYDQASYRKAVRAVLAAALAECEVDEQHGHDTRDGSTRTWHPHVCPDTTRRRLVIKTPAVDTHEDGAQP